MVTLTPTQAEAWMREHPGRWLETTMGDLVCAHESGTLRRPVYLLLRVGSRGARRIETINGFDFHPPREHWAAEVRKVVDFLDEEGSRIAAIVGGQPVTTRVMNAAANTLRALFRAAPEGS